MKYICGICGKPNDNIDDGGFVRCTWDENSKKYEHHLPAVVNPVYEEGYRDGKIDGLWKVISSLGKLAELSPNDIYKVLALIEKLNENNLKGRE